MKYIVLSNAQIEVGQDADGKNIARLDTRSVIIESSGTLSSVGTGGSTLPLTGFSIRALIKRIRVKKTSGDATSFNVVVYNKSTSPGENNIVYEKDSISSVDDNKEDIPFVNADGVPKIHVKVTPNSGSNNAFSILVSGIEGA